MAKWIWPLLAGSLLVGLTACSTPQERGSGGLVAPPGETAPAGGEIIVVPEAGGTEEIETDEIEVEVEVGAEGESLTVKETPVRAPDGSLWQKDAADREQHLLDLEACHNYADAQVRHDEQIWVDQNAAIDNITTSSRYSQVQRQQDAYEFSKRQDRLISSCMQGKGYYKL